ncbi:alpha/beta fold hydrolase [Mycobacterium shigaense]|uniref:Alpha/beta hydrolase n=1 Tax=Mycobacterium shigaense TaxID=722731 RepID=A0A1Z4EB63_9MYCO|nr:alpha/beta hydrolase [Mycobacterium shigaense]MEA1121471.1 alpha/beta hydrolase [Mycobacterium shigaense]PRI15238.1 alpha/beta hydrolase [Mycobacterium shigaense]BAX90194.1 alpha/beta hydrolase [Mycobacterium shigaense]
MGAVTTVRAGVLEVAFEQHGDPGGWPVVLLHGFPYDVRCYDRVTPALVAAGAVVVVPYLRGYGPTRFIDGMTPRSGQQAALGADLRELLGALGLSAPIVAGFDWGGRAACVAAALWPQLVRGLVSVSGYNVQHISAAATPAPPEFERRLWYQYYLHGERGRAGLSRYRREFARQLWQEWSPDWLFSDAEFHASAVSFENPDFVDVVVHSYRHRYGLVAGDPAYQALEDEISTQPPISVPTVVIDPQRDTMVPFVPSRAAHEWRLPGLLDVHHVQAGHNVPQEAPDAFAAAILHVHHNS